MGRENEEERTKRTSVWGHVLPLPPTPSTSQMLLPVTSPSWEEMGSFSFKCLPKKRDGGLNSRSMVSQGGGK